MKGDRYNPQCGFSRTMIGLINETGYSLFKLIIKYQLNSYILFIKRHEYDTFDILRDEEVRAGLKAYSNWPTYPQLYVDGMKIKMIYF